MSDKLSLKNELAALDQKHRDFYEELDEHDRSKFSPYIMMRYSANVDGSTDLQTWYLCATNERVNRDFFSVSTSKHKKLQWLLCTTVSPELGNQRHYWLKPKKSDPDHARAVKFLKQIYPFYKDDEIDLLARINNKEDLRNLARGHGWEETRIKAQL